MAIGQKSNFTLAVTFRRTTSYRASSDNAPERESSLIYDAPNTGTKLIVRAVVKKSKTFQRYQIKKIRI